MLSRPNQRLCGNDVDPATGAIKTYLAVDQGENGVIAAEPNIFARQELRAPLPDNDVTGNNGLTAELLYAQSLADAIATVFDASLSFFMSHWEILES
jgi:hypothetical protein